VGGDIYTPPECKYRGISGFVTGSDKFEDGSPITTSKIVKVEGRTVITHSGSRYTLGTPDMVMLNAIRYKEDWPYSFDGLMERVLLHNHR
jgi:hypothetical protein